MKYALHPGFIIVEDYDSHYLGFYKLLRLYKLKKEDCIEWDDEKPWTYLGRKKEDFIHLYPSTKGDYKINE